MEIQVKKTVKTIKFVEHIEEHLKHYPLFPKGSKVMCKICGKTIDEIYEE